MNDHTPDSAPVQLDLPSNATEIPLSKGHVATVDACDADLALLCWHAVVSKEGAVYGARHARRSDGKRYYEYLHRVVMSRALNRPLTSSDEVDHQNRDGRDCRRQNLRLATPTQNHANQARNTCNTSGYKGVSRYRATGKWQAYINVNNRRIHLGYFDDPAEAHEAYKDAAKKHFGEFARFD